MNNVFLPEIQIYNYLKSILSILKSSIETDENNNYITTIFRGQSAIGNYNPVKEAKAIFRKEDALKISFGFNLSTTNLPAVHIVLPDESVDFEGIGFSENYDRVLQEDGSTIDTEYHNIRYSSEYSLLIVDKNADSVIYIYQVLKYMLLCNFQNMQLDGFMNLKISGRDLVNIPNMVPQSMYSRNIILSFKYEYEFASINVPQFGSSLKVKKEFLDMEQKVEDIDVPDSLPPEGD